MCLCVCCSIPSCLCGLASCSCIISSTCKSSSQKIRDCPKSRVFRAVSGSLFTFGIILYLILTVGCVEENNKTSRCVQWGASSCHAANGSSIVAKDGCCRRDLNISACDGCREGSNCHCDDDGCCYLNYPNEFNHMSTCQKEDSQETCSPCLEFATRNCTKETFPNYMWNPFPFSEALGSGPCWSANRSSHNLLGFITAWILGPSFFLVVASVVSMYTNSAPITSQNQNGYEMTIHEAHAIPLQGQVVAISAVPLNAQSSATSSVISSQAEAEVGASERSAVSAATKTGTEAK